MRQVAKRDKNAKFTALLHHVTVKRLRSAFFALRKDAAAGIDGQRWAQYHADLEARLQSLHGRLHRGAYRAKPSRRVYIAKADGRQRPLGIAVLEDKIVQRAVAEVMGAIYEQDFLGFSYGFRPGRNQHQALDALATGIDRKKVNWVLDADIRGFFDAIDHGWMVRFIEHRIADRRLVRLIQKWLSAGVVENGVWTDTEAGTPQGAGISPLLANIYLHYVFDLWARQWRDRRARGDMVVIRYADDIVVGFQHRAEAERFLRDLRGRMQTFSLELHPDKTRLIAFGRFAHEQKVGCPRGKPQTFDFLGLTHICGKTRAGKFSLRRHTMRVRMRAKLHDIKTELKRRMHRPVPEQGAWLGSVVRGYYAYHAIPTNMRALRAFRRAVERLWLRALRRRSQNDRTTWERMARLSRKWLPRPRILHPWPTARFDARTRGKSPVR